MGRQQTLGKFFEMPKSTKAAPPQQANLQEMWGKKKEPAAKPEPDVPKAECDAMVIDTREEKRAESSKRKESTAPIASSPKIKKRRIIDEDDEDPNGVPPRSSPEPTMNGSNKSSSPISRTKETSPIPASRSRKTQGKEKAASPSGTTTKSVLPADDADESSSSDEGEEEVDDLEEEEELVSNKAVTTKSAQVALQKRDDVDIEGGWKVGAPVPYAALSKAFSLIEATTKRLEKTTILTSFLLLVIQRSAKNDHTSLLQAVYLCINRLSPDYVGVELGIGESLLIKAIGESTGRSLSVIKADLKKEGDLGLVAMNSKNSQKTLFKPKALTIPFVFSHLRDIALSSGHSSQAKKVSIITKMLAACQDFEAKYIVRSLEGKLRIGNAERSVLVALSQAVVLAERERSNKKWSQDQLAARLEEGAYIIKSVYRQGFSCSRCIARALIILWLNSELPTYDLVIPALLEVGIDGLREKCKLTPGVPLKPMLAKPTKAIGEVLDRFENKRFTCEYKYDGERAQVHMLEDGSVKVFSRNSEDMSKKYPDLVDQLPKCIKESTKSFVFDAEAVAIDRTTGKLMPFQELSRRKRKDVKVEDITVQVSLFAFDLLYLNGEPLLQLPLYKRRELLREHFTIVPGEFNFAKSSDSETTEEIQTFLEESVKDGCEGLMVKMLDTDASFYEPSRRSVNWLKLKKDYLAGVGDSLDLVVVGGYYGKGKRTNVYGAFLLACYDSDSEEFQTICKIGTGFSEEVLQTHYDTLKPLELTKPRGDIKVGGAKPDIWFEPKIVWEVLTADLSLSPIYTAAQGLVEDRGISLRFPRYLRIRDDKSADDATGPEQIAEMYERQALAQPKGKKKKGGDADDEFW
ncbi:hypothetical protein CVT25_001963 [Psilocybe cyanescens]|uniref:DNA ligase n=1 Tax=Psilocybe cyanescens TaxID=93625 RepID=A0A409WQQ6_PSICY|nr:hypothetical protein CVT25_001963 [Psilocybe cyanescens]